MFLNLLHGAALIWRLDTFAMIALGLVLGMLVGALPGFTTTMAMAILAPLSFFLSPLVGIPFLLGVYKGGIWGGSVPAVLVGIPGTGASIATTFEGPALARKGQARKGLEMTLFASVFGNTSGDILTLFFIGPIALVALKVGPPELAAIVLLSLVVIATTASGAAVKGLIMGFLGLLFAMIGQDPIGFMSRFTFGVFQLRAGIPLLPMLIGVFAIPEILIAIETEGSRFIAPAKGNVARVGERMKFREFWRYRKTLARSTGIGAALGATPGVGQVVAALVSYASAKKASKHPETFGTGELDGVAAAESANNAVNGPTMVPLLTLGIPGDNVTAILMGAFIAQGLRPGPLLFSQHGPMVYALLVISLLGDILFIALGYLLIPVFSKIVTIRKSILFPAIIIFAFAGSFVYRSNPFDLIVLVFFGLIGYAARKLHFDVAPMVMAFILGPILEYAFGQTVSMAGGGGNLLNYVFTARPFAAGIFLLIPLFAIYSTVRALQKRRAQKGDAAAK